ncbi:MAG: Uma2 family endonuclease, partial [Acidimicrobiales bacterium]
MSVAAGATHVGPWNEEDLVGLPEDGQRRELLEGSMLVSPPPGGPHQLVSWEVTRRLRQVVPPDLVAVEAMGLRLPDHTLFIPDVLVAEREAVVADRS